MYTCTFCVAEGGDPVALTFANDALWLDHLCSPDHGAKQRIRGAKKTFAHWDDKRTLVVSGIFGLKLRSLVNYFSGLGDLQNFYYVHTVDGGSNYCKALMADEKSAKKIHKTGYHKIGGVTFLTRIQNQPAAKPPPANLTPASTPAKGGQVPAKVDASSSSSTSNSNSTSVPTSIGSSTVSSSTGVKASDKFRRLHGADEGGFVPGVGYRCRICEEVVGSGEEKWVQHLISKQHQEIHKENQHLRKVLWDLDKKIKVSRIKGMNAVHILRYVAAFGGPVVDFSYQAKKDKGAPYCHVLFANRDSAEKLTKVKENHVIGPQRKNVLMFLVKDDQKQKWRKWRDKLLQNVGEEPTDYGSASEEDEDQEDDKVKEIPVPTTTTTTASTSTAVPGLRKVEAKKDVVKAKPVSENASKKRKSSELSHKKSEVPKSIPAYSGLSLSLQLDKFQEEFGWSSTFLTSARKFVDQTVGSLHLKQRKIPFGDLTTGLGLQTLPILQLLVDVHDILESKPESSSSNPLILSMIKNSSQTLEGLKTKGSTVHPILKIWTTESEVCLNTRIENQATCLKLRFSNALPFYECSLFKFCTDLDSRILPMSFIIGHWATSNNFLQDSKQSYPNQLIVLMILSYLQLKKVLPTVQKLILIETCADSKSPKKINGNNVSFCMDLKAVKKLHPNPLESVLTDDTIRAMSVLGLLRDWFAFYANSDLKENAICSRFGVLIPKKDFQPDSVGNLPGDLCRVYRFGMSKDETSPSKAESVTMKKFLCSQTPLCIQHPFDLSLNCSRGVTPNEVLRFQNGCKEASSVLSTLLTCDQPDLTQFLSITIPPVENKAMNVSKKLKIEEVVIDTTPQKSDSVVSITSSTSSVRAVGVVTSDKVVSSSSAAVVVSKPAETKKVVANPVTIPTIASPRSSKATASDKSLRPGAADFFDSIIETVSEPSEIGDQDEDEDEDGSMDDNESVLSDATNKDCTIVLNTHLFRYFERAFPGTRDMKFKKCQLLILQHILDFNSKFWTNCLGLAFLPKVGQKFWAEDFSKVLGEGNIQADKTLMQKVMGISDTENEINLNFRVKSDGGIIHKMFTEMEATSLRPKTWAAGRTLTECSLLLYEEVPESRLEEIKSSTFVSCNQLNQPEITFDCRLLGAAFNTFGKKTPLATLTMNVVSGSSEAGGTGTNYARIDVIKALYRKLGMTYINKMVKRWLTEATDFDHEKAANFVRDRDQRWNRKANRKKKNLEKQRFKQEAKSSSTKIPPVHNPRFNSQQASTSFRPQQQAQTQQQFRPNGPKPNFRPPAPVHQQMAMGRGRGYHPPNPQHYNNHHQQQPPYSSGGGGGMGRGMGRGIAPRPFMDNYHDYQQRGNNGAYNYYEPSPSSDRILRNPGPQGMRTFYPPHQQPIPSQPQYTHFHANPQFTTSQSSYNGFAQGIDNAELSFQSLPQAQQQHQGHQQPFHHGFNPSRADINMNDPQRTQPSLVVPNPQYQNPSYSGPEPLLPTPTPRNDHSFPSPPRNHSGTLFYEQQQPRNRQIMPEYNSYNNNQLNHEHDRYETHQHQHRFDAPTNNDLPPLIHNPHFVQHGQQHQDRFSDPNPNYDCKPPRNHLNPNIRHFDANPMSQTTIHSNHGPPPSFTREQFPIKSNPHSSFENSYSRPDRPPNPTLPGSGNNHMSQPVFHGNREHGEEQRTRLRTAATRPSRYFNANNNNSNNNFTHSSNSSQFPYETRTPLPTRELSHGSRPSQPVKRGFVSGGYLSTDKVAESDSDDDLQIIYDVDPKGNSSPPPPPLKKYKIGPAFPVPSKPSSMGRGRRSVSPLIFRNPMAEQRKGYISDPRTSTFPNPMNQNQYRSNNPRGSPSPPEIFSPSDDFQEFGSDPFADSSSQHYGGRRF